VAGPVPDVVRHGEVGESYIRKNTVKNYWAYDRRDEETRRGNVGCAMADGAED
jgi:hypothetical protein